MSDDLRAFFGARGATGRFLTAQEVFSDRTEELEAFDLALDDHRRWHKDVWAPALSANDGMDLSISRENVLVYYGVGGIGKTALSKRLENKLLTAAKSQRTDAATFRWDLGESGARDFESFMLGLRVAIGELRRPLQAFDFLLAQYWASTHPGQDFREHIGRNTFYGRAARRIGLSQRMDDMLDAVGSTVTSSSALFKSGADAAAGIFRAIKRGHVVRKMRKDSTYFERLADAEPSGDTLSYMASVLAWELSKMGGSKHIDVVAFVDTYETVNTDSTRLFERLFQRVVYLTPNILWVITGRNRLDWDLDSLEGELDYIGAQCWSQLVPQDASEGRQHLIGFLSDHDANDYLEKRVVLRNRPAIPAELRATIVQAAQGLPMHLDLTVMRYMNLADDDGNVPTGEFDTAFAMMVSRIMRDLDDEECRLLEATSLLSHFDMDLAVEAAGGNITDARFRRFLKRPFVVTSESSLWPYRIHDVVRSILNENASVEHGRWSQRERRAAALRAFRHAGRQLAHAITERDRATLYAGLEQFFTVAREYRLEPEWLGEAAFALHESSSWQSVLPDELADGAIESDADAIAVGFAAVSRRRTADREWLVRRLDEVLRWQLIDDDLTDLFVRYRSHALRRLGRNDEALAGYRQIARRSGRLASEAEWNIVRHYTMHGAFRSAIDEFENTKNSRAGMLRIIGNIHRDNAIFTEAEARYIQAAEAAEHAREHGRRSLCLSDLALVRAWHDAPEVPRDVERAYDAAKGTGRRQPYQQGALAMAISMAGRDPKRFDSYMAEYRSRSRAARMAENELLAAVVEAFNSALMGRTIQLRSVARDVHRISDTLGIYGFWGDVVRWWQGLDSPNVTAYEWLGGAEAARERWTAVVENRQR